MISTPVSRRLQIVQVSMSSSLYYRPGTHLNSVADKEQVIKTAVRKAIRKWSISIVVLGRIDRNATSRSGGNTKRDHGRRTLVAL